MATPAHCLKGFTMTNRIDLYSCSVLFPLGQVVITANASRILTAAEVLSALHRHASGDWGEVCRTDAKMNDKAVGGGNRVLSAYGEGNGRFWIITEADRSVTTVLLPDD